MGSRLGPIPTDGRTPEGRFQRSSYSVVKPIHSLMGYGVRVQLTVFVDNCYQVRDFRCRACLVRPGQKPGRKRSSRPLSISSVPLGSQGVSVPCGRSFPSRLMGNKIAGGANGPNLGRFFPVGTWSPVISRMRSKGSVSLDTWLRAYEYTFASPPAQAIGFYHRGSATPCGSGGVGCFGTNNKRRKVEQ